MQPIMQNDSLAATTAQYDYWTNETALNTHEYTESPKSS